MPPWELFFKEKITKLFADKKRVIDIGAGLRFEKHRGNRFEERMAWIAPLAEGVEYQVLDPVPDYHPDIIGDIHNLPLADNSVPGMVCLAVLEHVEDPFRAVWEMHRVLEPGGYLFVYVPFLFYYHAEKGYYKDFWRYTEDGIKNLFKDFSHMEYAPVRGAFETWIKLSPLGTVPLVTRIARSVDRVTGKSRTKQVSGYHAFMVK